MKLFAIAGVPLPDLPNAACRETADPDAFFPFADGATDRARAICAFCLDRAACLQYALENNEMWGVWGGMTAEQRRRLMAVRAAS